MAGMKFLLENNKRVNPFIRALTVHNKKILARDPYPKVIYTKYSKHWPYTVAHTIDCVCSKINHGSNHGLFISLLKLILCPIHWIVNVLALPKTAGSAQTHKSISSKWIVWITLYVYLWQKHQSLLMSPNGRSRIQEIAKVVMLYLSTTVPINTAGCMI